MMRRSRWYILLALAGLFMVVATPAAAQSPERLVLAFYYTWFDENSWSPATLPDLPAHRYVSRDRGVMARHIDQARAAGIDALVVSWYGPAVTNNQTETNFRAMLDEAAVRGLRLAVDVEVTSPFFGGAGDVQAALAALLATHARHPAYLKVGGKPVIFFWRQQAYGAGTWAAIRAAVDPGHNSIWIEEGVDVSLLSVFDGHHLYKVIWNPPTDLSYTANKFGRFVRAAAQSYGTPKVYVATAMPGWDDRRTGRGDSFGISREGGVVYERSWQAAIGSSPDWIIITSFNEWPEGTYIEPSQAFGDLFLGLTAKWAAAFKSSTPPVLALPALAPLPASAPPAATQRAEQALTPHRTASPRFLQKWRGGGREAE